MKLSEYQESSAIRYGLKAGEKTPKLLLSHVCETYTSRVTSYNLLKQRLIIFSFLVLEKTRKILCNIIFFYRIIIYYLLL